jgi:hypothetical protein
MSLSPLFGLRGRFISWAICLCAVLALSTTLSASSTVLTLGDTSAQYGSVYVGPYPGAVEQNSDPTQQLVVSLFCLDGNLTDYFTYQYPGTVEPLSALSGDSNFQSEEEAAFLASLVLYEAQQDNIAISVAGVGGNGLVTQIANGSVSVTDFVNNVEAPISFAIWQIMGTLDGSPDPAAAPYVLQAQNAYTNILQYSSTPLVAAFNSSVMIFIPADSSTQRFFTAYGDVGSMVPEPGTMALFGTGIALMALGCARRLRRPR